MSRIRSILVAACLLGVGACAPTGQVYVAGPPPPARAEYVGAAPHPGAFWVSGHWWWSGDRYVWVGGHWEQRRAGYAWERGGWVKRGRVWVYTPGRWRRF